LFFGGFVQLSPLRSGDRRSCELVGLEGHDRRSTAQRKMMTSVESCV
jgi:hypothetical protein